jgi:hypothetical protein
MIVPMWPLLSRSAARSAFSGSITGGSSAIRMSSCSGLPGTFTVSQRMNSSFASVWTSSPSFPT